MRKFELITDAQWAKDAGMDAERKLPLRGSTGSAGYDFFAPIEIVIPAHGMEKIPTGVKAAMNEEEVLMLYPRSSIGFKTGIRLANTIGVVDFDYYNNEDNEGHIWVKFHNPTDEDYTIAAGDRFAQGIFMNYLTTDDDEAAGERTGGLGSTGK